MNRETLLKQLSQITPADEFAMEQAKKRWDSIAKPLGSLGLLEDALIRVAGLTGDVSCDLSKKGVLVFCADNGVVAQGVTQTGSEVTAVVAENLTRAQTSVCRMARVAGATVIPVDVGMNTVVDVPGLFQKKAGMGTKDISVGPAMEEEQFFSALETGIELVRECKENGYHLLATGEMGIGNTTTSSAVASVLLGLPPEKVTGKGAGLSDSGLLRKVEVIREAIRVNAPDPSDPFDVVRKVGGFDIAGIMGAFLGGALYGVPVLADGFISCVAALCAVRACSEAKKAVFASHVSAEPAGHMVLEALGLEPLITARMRLGEGTGAVAAMPLFDMAAAVYRGMSTFSDIEIEEYKPL